MNELFPSLSNAFLEYINNANFQNSDFWLAIFIPLLGVYLLSVIVLQVGRNKTLQEAYPFLRTFEIHRAVMLSSMAVSAILIGLYIYYWSQNLYASRPLQLSHMLSFILVFSIGLLAFYFLRELLGFQNRKNYIKNAITYEEEQENIVLARKQYLNLKWLLLIPIAGFLLLGMLNYKNYNLVSFVLDTSTSMLTANDIGEVPIETGKTALRKTVNELDQWTDVVITKFEDASVKPYKESIAEVMSTQGTGVLSGSNQFFLSTEKASTLSYINTLSEGLSGDSPLCETVWSNFLFVKELSETNSDRPYANVVSIIVTDGAGNLGSEIDGFLCENVEFFDFFDGLGDINVLNLSNQGEYPGFIDLAQQCNYTVWEGYQANDFTTALNDILNNYKSDWTFPIWIVIIYTLLLIIGLLIFPQRSI